MITTAHVGDSRMVIFDKSRQSIFATKDHTIDPHDPYIKAAGGEVREETHCGVTAFRIFARGGLGPGLAMGRSLGDQMAHSLGCRSTPDVSEIPFEEGQTLVLASDGLWDKLHAGTVSVIVHAVDDATAAARHVVSAARAQWGDGPDVDDVTAVVLRC
jgi:serine/threonine protein phosphatase PrpC